MSQDGKERAKCQKEKNHGHVEKRFDKCLEHASHDRDSKLIDRMPKIMHAIIEAEGFKTPYWVCMFLHEISLNYGDFDGL